MPFYLLLSVDGCNVIRGEAAHAQKLRTDCQTTTFQCNLCDFTTIQSDSELLDTLSNGSFSCSSIFIAAGCLRRRMRLFLSAVASSASLAILSTSCVLNTNLLFNATRFPVLRCFRLVR
ncbi:hypothetical protein M433DRAFT_538145, partial [Acidomyces richmondensis BFW]